MTLTSVPTAPADLYAVMGVESLLAHLHAIIDQLKTSGVEITPSAQLGLDEIDECAVDFFGRRDPDALARHLAKTTSGSAAQVGGVA